MKNHPRFTVLIFLIFATSFNLEAKAVKSKLRTYLLHSALIRQLSGGERINDLIAKFNERRAAGILAQPRIGRNSGLGSFGRPDGAAGLVQYPRVGRAGPPVLTDDLKYPEVDGEVRNHREGLDGPLEGDEQNLDAENFDDEFRRRLGNGIWLDTPRYGPRTNRPLPQCENQIDSAGIFIVSPRDYQKMERQMLHYFPRPSGDHSR